MNYKLILQIILIYVALTILVYFTSNFSIFVPPRSSYKDSVETLKLTTQDGKKITALYLHNPQAKFVLLYSHGNAEDLGRIKPVLEEFYSWGFSVISYDYHGYGTSEGSPSEVASYYDIDAVYEYLVKQQNIPANNIIVYGRSVGTGPSVDLAMHKPIAGLILEGAFVSAYRVVTHFPIFFPDKYNNISKLKDIHVPILFIHAEDDTVIHLWHGEKLYATYTGPKEYYWIENANHNDRHYENSMYKQTVLGFINSLKNQTAD